MAWNLCIVCSVKCLGLSRIETEMSWYSPQLHTGYDMATKCALLAHQSCHWNNRQGVKENAHLDIIQIKLIDIDFLRNASTNIQPFILFIVYNKRTIQQKHYQTLRLLLDLFELSWFDSYLRWMKLIVSDCGLHLFDPVTATDEILHG